MSTRKRDYLFKRSGSQYWRIRFQIGGRSVEHSLKTMDRREAELAALPLIAEHKAKLLAARPRLEPDWVSLFPPGLHVGPPKLAEGSSVMSDLEAPFANGGRIFATERELHYLDANGAVIRSEANGKFGYRTVNFPIGAVIHWGKSKLSLSEMRRIGPVFDLSKMERPTVPTKNGDDAVLETYLKHANITGYYEREARTVWALYKTLTKSKPLKDADRDDGRKLVEHFEGEGLKSATIAKKVGWLTAACNLAIKEGKLKFNPFASVVPKRNDSQRRLPLSDDDMKVIKRNLARLSEFDQSLMRLLASTGMRLSEAFEISGEEKERGVRYVMVGKKTEQSLRRVPLPGAVLPYLPKDIKGPLFVSVDRDPADAASKKLNRFLDDCGIDDPRKVVHSLRHRAQDRLRAAGCPEDVRWAILGHEEETVAAGYGEGFPVPLLKKWIDKIGC
jgi:integrase